MIEDFAGRQNPLVVGPCVVPRTSQNHLKPAGVGDGDAADIEEMDCRGESIQCLVAIEAEACEQYLECHPIADVRELGAVTRPRASDQRASRFVGLCVRADKSDWSVDLAPDQRSGYVRPGQCVG